MVQWPKRKGCHREQRSKDKVQGTLRSAWDNVCIWIMRCVRLIVPWRPGRTCWGVCALTDTWQELLMGSKWEKTFYPWDRLAQLLTENRQNRRKAVGERALCWRTLQWTKKGATMKTSPESICRGWRQERGTTYYERCNIYLSRLPGLYGGCRKC